MSAEATKERVIKFDRKNGGFQLTPQDGGFF